MLAFIYQNIIWFITTLKPMQCKRNTDFFEIDNKKKSLVATAIKEYHKKYQTFRHTKGENHNKLQSFYFWTNFCLQSWYAAQVSRTQYKQQQLLLLELRWMGK